MGNYRNMMIMVAIAMVLMSSAQAQTAPDMPCMQALIPCTPALETTGTPPTSCCGPLRAAFETQLPCLCAVFQNTELAAAANVNLTKAMELPARCGIKGDPSMCATGQGPSPALAPVAGGPTTFLGPVAGGPTTSPAVASTPTSSPGSNAGSNVAWTGSVSSLMMLLSVLMFY
ncbi:Lipid transfer-like protein VAS [Bienertia sinuspersici]